MRRTHPAVAELLNLPPHIRQEGGAAQQVTSLSRPPDAAKLKKHITLVCDRLHKGLRPKGAAGAQANGDAN